LLEVYEGEKMLGGVSFGKVNWEKAIKKKKDAEEEKK